MRSNQGRIHLRPLGDIDPAGFVEDRLIDAWRHFGLISGGQVVIEGYDWLFCIGHTRCRYTEPLIPRKKTDKANESIC